MEHFRIPSTEAARLQSLKVLNILDTLPEIDYDQITSLASYICGTPVALISLVDESRQWFKSNLGLKINETPRPFAFCAHTILKNEILVVNNALADERFSDNPYVAGAPFIRFYVGAPLFSPDGKPIGSVCVIDFKPRTITPEQMKALQALSSQVTKLLELRIKAEQIRSSEQRNLFKSIATENIVEGVVLQNSSGAIIDFNPAALEVLDLTEDQLLGKTSFDPSWKAIHEDGSIFPGSEHPAIVCLRTSQKQTSVIMGIQTTHNGQRWLKISSVPMFQAGEKKASHVVTSFADITALKTEHEQKKAIEAQLAESSRLSALGEMGASIAHEINNPLTIIQGTAQVLKLKLETTLENHEVFSKELTTISNTVDRIAKTIRALKNCARKVDDDPFVLNSIKLIIEDAIEICSHRFRDAEIPITLVCNSAFYVPCRPTQISQIIVNLLCNSFDAISLLPQKFVEIEVTEESDHFEIIVRDSGKGISPVICKKIMDPFFTTKDVGKGTGLGLSISQRLAHSHGGDLVYLSDQTHTIFLLTIAKERGNF